MSDLTELIRLRMIIEQTFKGGEGSGNFGHAGRPGEVGGSSSGGIEINDKLTAGNEKRFLKGRVSKDDIYKSLESGGAGKIDSYLQIGRASDSSMSFKASYDKRESGGFGFTTMLEIYEDGHAKLYPNGMYNPTWKDNYKRVAKPITDTLKGKGFTYLSIPIPQGSSEKWYKVDLSS